MYETSGKKSAIKKEKKKSSLGLNRLRYKEKVPHNL